MKSSTLNRWHRRGARNACYFYCRGIKFLNCVWASGISLAILVCKRNGIF
nr:MAG TPA: hypothetical protein [Caudoviricetes sp.]